MKKQVHEIPELILQNGRLLRNVRMGYETYGTLSPARDNAILVAHYYTGSSHAAGRYAESDPEPGYWNGLVGPGKGIDTDRFFVVSCDSLCNFAPKLPHVVTTGPASLNPETGRVYGADFPVVTIGDFVEAQNHLAVSLGISEWHAVAGPSMGGMQALEWSARYPEKVPRTIACIAPGLSTEPYLIAKLNAWCAPILLDPAFRDGHYHYEDQPKRGLAEALKLVTLDAIHMGYARRIWGRRWADADPSLALKNKFAIEAGLDALAIARAEVADANSFLRLARAVQTFSIEDRLAKLRSKYLYLPARTDLLMYPEFADAAITELRKRGLSAEKFVIEGDGGHLDGLNNISQATEVVREFLAI